MDKYSLIVFGKTLLKLYPGICFWRVRIEVVRRVCLHTRSGVILRIRLIQVFLVRVFILPPRMLIRASTSLRAICRRNAPGAVIKKTYNNDGWCYCILLYYSANREKVGRHKYCSILLYSKC